MLIHPNIVDYITDPLRRPYLLYRETLLHLFAIVEFPKRYGSMYNNPKLVIGDSIDDPNRGTYHTKRIYIDNTKANIYTIKNKNVVRLPVETGMYEVGDLVAVLFNKVVDGEVPTAEAFTISSIEKNSIDTTSTAVLVKNIDTKEYNEYNFVQDNLHIYGVIDNPGRETLIKIGDVGKPVLEPYYDMVINKGQIENYNENTPLSTTFGSYLINYYTLASVFGSTISYINDEISSISSQIENHIVSASQEKTVTTEQMSKYLDNAIYLGSMGELCAPVFSAKSIVTDPDIDKYKKELLEKYADRLHDPVIQAHIEDLLIKKDKEWLAGDISEGYYGDSGKKFNVHRKKQFLAGGATEGYVSGEYDFVVNSLSEGWDVSSFATLVNENRRGSYSRGVETQDGGARAKSLQRAFQSVSVTGDDCGSNKYMEVDITHENVSYYMYRYMLRGNDLVEIDNDIAKTLIGKRIKIRSPLYCVQPGGYCYRCVGELFKRMDMKNIGVLVLEVGKVFTTGALKKMHGTKLETFDVSDINKFIN